ncbi:MAG: hypothetical protein M1821_009286 [Bathelium mastoideum]|nr:MAG: hypothetical protein M1821_009286 [Bathelium mastoideum]
MVLKALGPPDCVGFWIIGFHAYPDSVEEPGSPSIMERVFTDSEMAELRRDRRQFLEGFSEQISYARIKPDEERKVFELVDSSASSFVISQNEERKDFVFMGSFMTGFVTALCHSDWLDKIPVSRRYLVLQTTLNQIDACMKQILHNVRDSKDAIEELQRDYSTCIYPATRLWRILSLVIDQHVGLLSGFVFWAKRRLVEDKEAKNSATEKVPEIEDKISETRKTQKLPKLGNYELDASDYKVITALEEQWVCRVPQEITILILRVLFEARQRKKELTGSVFPKGLQKFFRDDRQSLREFLGFLRSDRWESLVVQDKIPPLVPMSFSFDETYERIGTSRPTWPNGAFANRHPWPDYMVGARDERVKHKIAQAELESAESAG